MTAPTRRYLPVCPHERDYCLVVSCRYHEILAPTGCTLDLACDGPSTLPEIGRVIGTCKERVRQIEQDALRKAHRSAQKMGLTLADLLPIAQLDWDDAMPSTEED